jgi:transketolase
MQKSYKEERTPSPRGRGLDRSKAEKSRPFHFNLRGLEKKARELRATCIQMAHDSREGHLKSALSCVEILVALYYTWLNVNPEKCLIPERDRFILSKGHACSALYAVLADRGFFPVEWLSEYGRSQSPLPNHPCKHALPLLECSSGSLGHGLGIATGMLYGFKLNGNKARLAVLMSDGECNEGSVWEAAMFASAHRMDNLLAVVDNNGVQAVGRSEEIMGNTSLEEKFRSFGWAARTLNGNHLSEVIEALGDFPFKKGRPSAIIAKTTAGSGVSFMEDQVLWHYRVPSDEDLHRALQELEAIPLHKDPKR